MRKYSLLFILVFIGANLRFSNLDSRGLFTDEKFTLLNANGIWVGGGNQMDIFQKNTFTPADFWKSKTINDHFEAIAHSDFGTHIIYNGLLHLWMEIFGNSDYSIRFLSAVFSLLTVILVYLMALEIFKSYSAAFFSGFILALDPLNIAQSHIARSYTLSFLLVVLATYFFIKIIKETSNRRDFIIYSLLVGLAMLNHYLNFLLPLSHGIVFLFLRKNKHLWLGFISAAAFNVVLMLYWFNLGGGYLAMDFLKDKNQKHLKLAQLNADQPAAAITLSTPNVLAKKTFELIFDSSILSQSLFEKLNYGLKNVGLTLLVFGLFILTYFFKSNRRVYIPSVVLVVLILLMNYGSIEAILVANFMYFTIFFALEYVFQNFSMESKRLQVILVSICFLMLILPMLFVVNDAVQNGHTTSLTHRYIGVASPFVALLLGFGIHRFIKFSFLVWGLLGFVIFYQHQSVDRVIQAYFNDKSEMNAWFDPARVPNPYKKSAERILANYQENDTLIICGRYQEYYSKVFDTKERVSYNDAQYLNLYLPKNSDILEKIDAHEADKVFLKKKNGEKLLIFDFEGTKYRY